ncbi:cytochrome P450 [Trametes punicea]|nr:cytochrome P450 [Trametes punicea]
MFDSFGTPWPYLVIAAAALAWAIVSRARSNGRLPPLPPGPRPVPLLGNVLDFPKSHLGRDFRDLTDKYGDVVCLKVFSQTVILLGSYEVACELLAKRSANYSDRWQSVMINLTNLDWMVVFKNYGPEWRTHRRELRNSFNSDMMTQYYPLLLEITRQMLHSLLTNPAEFSAHVKFSFAAVILRIVYGLDAAQGEKKYYRLAERLAIIAEKIGTPGEHVVEAFPWMQKLPSWLPGTGFRPLARTYKEEVVDIRDHLFDSAKEAMTIGGVKESMVTRLVEEHVEEDLARSLTATIYAAGGDTTNAAVHAFFLAMAMHPQVQRKAQAELDAVVGPDRLPDFSHQRSLPYVNATLKEVLRWHVVGPIGVPHCSLADDEYRGYRIPGGSIVIANQWAMSRDPAHYPDPESFNPDRFLLDGQLNPNIRDPSDFAFGFGRRICPGLNFAHVQLFITFASILHAFTISPPLDERGVPKTLKLKATNLGVSHPEPFECRIEIRSPHMEELVRAAGASPSNL